MKNTGTREVPGANSNLIFGLTLSRGEIRKKKHRGTRSAPAQLVRLIGIEPTHPAPEADALSTELQAHAHREL